MTRRLINFVCFSVFIFFTVLIGTVGSLFLHIFIPHRRSRTAVMRGLTKGFFSFFVAFCSWVGLYRVKFHDRELISQIKNAVIIATHPSLVDYVILTSQLNIHTTTIFKSALEKGFMKYALHNLGYISNRNDEASCKKALQTQDNILIFPEGFRTKEYPLKFNRGAAQLAIRSHRPIYAILIECDTPHYLQHDFYPSKVPAKAPVFNIRLLKCIETSTSADDQRADGIKARHTTKDLEDLYNDTLACRNSQ